MGPVQGLGLDGVMSEQLGLSGARGCRRPGANPAQAVSLLADQPRDHPVVWFAAHNPLGEANGWPLGLVALPLA